MSGVRTIPLFLALLLPAAVAAAEAGPPALPLDEALRRLDADNLTVAQARGRAEEARGLARQAMAAFLPVVAANGAYTRNSDDARMSMNAILDSIETGLRRVAPITLDRSGVPDDVLIQPLEAFTGSATVRVPLFQPAGYLDWRAAQEGAKAAQASVDGVRLGLRSALVQAAWLAQAAEEIAEASERALAVAQEHERSAARAVEAGTAAPLTHLQSQTEVVRRESELARARAERERARLMVGVLLGRAEPVRIALPDEVPALAPGPEESLEAGLARRPELRAGEASIRVAERGIDSAWWRHAPQLSASFSVMGSDVPFPTGDKGAWRATVDLSWTLYDGGFRYGRRAQAEAQRITAQAALEGQKLEIRQQVLDALRDVDVAGERLRLAHKQQGLAREAAASAKRLFDAGLASSLDVLDANDRLYQSEVALADARARVGTARTALDRATGGLLQ